MRNLIANRRNVLKNKYLLVILALFLTLFLQMSRIKEYRLLSTSGVQALTFSTEELLENAEGMAETDTGTIRIKKNQASFLLVEDAEDNYGEIEIYINETSRDGLTGYVSYDESKKFDFKLTKGNNSILLEGDTEGADIRVVILDEKGTEINLEKISLLSDEADTIQLPWSSWLMSVLIVVLILSVMGKMALSKWIICVIFFGSFLAMVAQMNNVYFYFDDFGYRSLTYRNLLPEVSSQYGITDILAFLGNHYLKWGGRILYFFFEIILMQNISVIRIVEAALLTGYFWSVYKLTVAKHEKYRALAAMLPLCCYMLLEREILADGAYWFTAAALYVFPVMFVLLSNMVYYQMCFPEEQTFIKIKGKKGKVILFFLLFAASFSQEQYSAAMVAITFLTTVKYIREKGKPKLWQWLSLFFVLTGFFLLLFCPGNSYRLAESGEAEPFITKLAVMLNILGADNQKYITWVFFFIAAFVAWSLGSHLEKKALRIANKILGVVYISLLFVMIVYNVGLQSALQAILTRITAQDGKLGTYLLEIFFLAIILIQAMTWLWRERKWMQMEFITGALVTLSVCAVSPGVSIRALLPYYLLIIPYLAEMLIYAVNVFVKKRKRFAAIIVVCFFFEVSVLNYRYILLGYHVNAEIEEENQNRLENYTEYADGNQYIRLYRHADDAFGNMMPYQTGYQWIEDYIRKTYNIPEEYSFGWIWYNDYLKEKG